VSHTANWNEKVARGRRLVTEINDRKWELGDLANEVCPAGTPGAHDERLWLFADEIGIRPATLNEYRTIAAAWSPSARAEGQTWTTHRMLAAREDRHEIIAEEVWTYNSLSRRLGMKPNPSRVIADPAPNDEGSKGVPGLPSMLTEALSSEGSKEALMRTPETRRVIREALSDPQTAKDILKDRRVATAAERAMQSNEDEAETRAESEPTTKRFKNAERQARFQALLSKANLALRDAAVELAAIDPLVAHQIAEAEYELTEINSRAEWLRIHLGDSGKSLDAELADLLAEGAQ